MDKKEIKKEKGATSIDIATGTLIFILFTSLIFTLYLQIYKQTALIKIHQNAMGYIIEICEDIDMKNYKDIENLETYKNSLIEELELDINKYNLTLTQEKYIDTHSDAQDIVKRIKISIKYIFDNEERQIEVNKIKVQE